MPDLTDENEEIKVEEPLGEDSYEGRLELTWSNKNLTLLEHDGDSYMWVPHGDHRVSEVRLLRDAGGVGDIHPDEERAKDNLLIQGDALNALSVLTRSPEFAGEYLGNVKLVYLDPPFNTGEVFEDYDDGLEHSVWLTIMRDRLLQIKPLMAKNGSIWVHLDDSEVAYCRIILDEIFGRENFQGTVAWRKVHGTESRKAISTSQDYILVYGMNGTRWKESRNLIPRDEADASFSNPDNDERGVWSSGDFSAQAGHGTESQFYTLVTPSGMRFDPPEGRCWISTQERYEELVQENRIWFGTRGTARPRLKQFLNEVQDGIVPNTWWSHEEVGSNQDSKKEIIALFPDATPFTTPKPERLMERIIQIATNEGDVVLDCFAGSGTTAAVAHKLKRRWVTVEQSRTTVDTFTAPRLKQVVLGEDEGGISSTEIRYPVSDLPSGVSPDEAKQFTSLLKKFADHVAESEEPSDDDEVLKVRQKLESGYIKKLRAAARTRLERASHAEAYGGFRVLEVAPSIFEDDEGIVVLADWMADRELGEAVAAQLGFDYSWDQPFCASRGSLKLAVIDGHVDDAVVGMLVKALGPGEKVCVCATSLEAGTANALRKISRGSQARVIPQDILISYRTPSRWQVSVSQENEEVDAA